LWPAKGNLDAGADADFVLVDPSAERVIADADVVAKVGWTPFAGRRVTGRPLRTYVRGKLVAEQGKPMIDAGWGDFLPGPGYREESG
jgi:dihydroorotase-like cyclic amidohydrolase